jgi:hypothetical protein
MFRERGSARLLRQSTPISFAKKQWFCGRSNLNSHGKQGSFGLNMRPKLSCTVSINCNYTLSQNVNKEPKLKHV